MQRNSDNNDEKHPDDGPKTSVAFDLSKPSTSRAHFEEIEDSIEDSAETTPPEDPLSSSSASQSTTNNATSAPKQRTHFAMPSLSRDSLDSVVKQYRDQFTTPEPVATETGNGDGSKHPLDVAWKQQTLPAWQPQYRPATIVSLYLGFGFVLLAVGIPMLITMNRAHEVVVDYTDCVWDHSPANKPVTCAEILEHELYTPGEKGCTCTMDFKLPRDFKLPIYIYYELDGFYQNHRRYVASVDWNQLYGRDVAMSKLESNCAPYAKSNNSRPYGPCGAIANSMFSDEFKVYNENKTKLTVEDTGITWPTDKMFRFKNPDDWSKYDKPLNWSVAANELDPLNAENNGYKNEHFMVWMRTAAFPKFRKLWGRILPSTGKEPILEKGNYKVEIDYKYKTVQNKLHIPKRFVIATSTWLGGRNLFLPILYIVCGALSIVTGVAFLILSKRMSGKDRHRTDTVSMTTANYQTMGRTVTAF